jgi:hypothetical protein
MGITDVPGDIETAIAAFVSRRDQLEREFRVDVPRALENEVRAGIRRLAFDR